MKIFVFIITKLIRLYQLTISPLIGQNCRYHPSCSNYSIEALRKHGLFKGIKFSIKRILSCHPYGKSGHDPVP